MFGLSWLTSKILGALAAVGAVIAVIGGAYLKGRSEGASGERSRNRERELDSGQRRLEINRDVEASSDPDLDRRLGRWVRK